MMCRGEDLVATVSETPSQSLWECSFSAGTFLLGGRGFLLGVAFLGLGGGEWSVLSFSASASSSSSLGGLCFCLVTFLAAGEEGDCVFFPFVAPSFLLGLVWADSPSLTAEGNTAPFFLLAGDKASGSSDDFLYMQETQQTVAS